MSVFHLKADIKEGAAERLLMTLSGHRADFEFQSRFGQPKLNINCLWNLGGGKADREYRSAPRRVGDVDCRLMGFHRPPDD